MRCFLTLESLDRSPFTRSTVDSSYHHITNNLSKQKKEKKKKERNNLF
jgi:hypothetical protein